MRTVKLYSLLHESHGLFMTGICNGTLNYGYVNYHHSSSQMCCPCISVHKLLVCTSSLLYILIHLVSPPCPWLSTNHSTFNPYIYIYILYIYIYIYTPLYSLSFHPCISSLSCTGGSSCQPYLTMIRQCHINAQKIIFVFQN